MIKDIPIEFEKIELGQDAPKQAFWANVTRLPVLTEKLSASKANKDIVFTQAALNHVVYAYSAYLSILSLYVATDLDKYDVRVYCTGNLTELCEELFEFFPKVTVITLAPVLECHPEWNNDTDFEEGPKYCIKTQFWWDTRLREYKVTCGLDADLFGVGKGGSFKGLLEMPEDSILLAPTGKAWPIFTQMMECLNHNPKKRVLQRLEKKLGIKGVEPKIKAQPWWGNSSLHAFHTKLMKEKFSELLDFWFKEPCYCDESFLAVLSHWKGLDQIPVNEYLWDMDHLLEHSSIFGDKTKPMHELSYGRPATITHRLSTIDSANQLAPRFQEYVDWVRDAFRDKSST